MDVNDILDLFAEHGIFDVLTEKYDQAVETEADKADRLANLLQKKAIRESRQGDLETRLENTEKSIADAKKRKKDQPLFSAERRRIKKQIKRYKRDLNSLKKSLKETKSLIKIADEKIKPTERSLKAAKKQRQRQAKIIKRIYENHKFAFKLLDELDKHENFLYARGFDLEKIKSNITKAIESGEPSTINAVMKEQYDFTRKFLKQADKSKIGMKISNIIKKVFDRQSDIPEMEENFREAFTGDRLLSMGEVEDMKQPDREEMENQAEPEPVEQETAEQETTEPVTAEQETTEQEPVEQETAEPEQIEPETEEQETADKQNEDEPKPDRQNREETDNQNNKTDDKKSEKPKTKRSDFAKKQVIPVVNYSGSAVKSSVIRHISKHVKGFDNISDVAFMMAMKELNEQGKTNKNYTFMQCVNDKQKLLNGNLTEEQKKNYQRMANEGLKVLEKGIKGGLNSLTLNGNTKEVIELYKRAEKNYYKNKAKNRDIEDKYQDAV